MAWLPLLLLLALFKPANAQNTTCVNGGVYNGSGCDCPTGFGGSTCATAACGGDIFQGSSRALTTAKTAGFANISSCSCETGWGGTGCNVCSTGAACQAAYTASGKAPSANASIAGSIAGQNDTLTCNTDPRVYAASQMSCQVNNPTLQALFPLSSNLNIMRTLTPGLSPLPGSTSFGSNGSVFAQLFYEGVEQFYCTANSCVQTLNGDASSWVCQNLACSCFQNTTFCGASAENINFAISGLSGQLTIDCTNTTSCSFQQADLNSLFGQNGLGLSGCTFGECVAQGVIDTAATDTDDISSSNVHKELSGGVIGGLAAVGALILIALVALLVGCIKQRSARKAKIEVTEGNRTTVEWSELSYSVGSSAKPKVVLDSVSGSVLPGQMMAVLGPSGAGKTTLVEILAGKAKSGTTTGRVSLNSSAAASTSALRIGFVPQQDVLPAMLTVYEALLFAARLRLPENVSDVDKRTRVEGILETLGIAALRDVRIGWGGDVGGGKARGISGGEMRRVSIGLELIASPDVLILDEPTSGLDSVSASRVASVLHSIAHDSENPIPVIASIHQPSSQLYQTFDTIMLMSHGRALYCGPGGFAPADHFAREAADIVPAYQQGYNVADYLLEVASEPPAALFQVPSTASGNATASGSEAGDVEKGSLGARRTTMNDDASVVAPATEKRARGGPTPARQAACATTFLTQLEYLSGREWKILRRDKSLFFTHVAVAAVLGVFCGGLYYKTGITIAGFQSRVGCLFFLGALIAFSSLSALYNVVLNRPLFLRERSGSYYSPTAWLLSRVIFDVLPLRIVPTILVATITYWMAGLAHDAAHFFKFLFILVLFTLAMTLFNFLLGTLFNNGGIAILLSALSALYQMTFAGFFVHLNSIPPVLRWLQWLCPLKYSLEALAVNEVGSGLMIQDTLQGVPVDVSAELIMNLLFGFGANNYYRDVLVLFAFIAGFAVMVIGVVWWKVRERR